MNALLIVEDSDDDVFFLRRALKTAGVTCPIFVAEDGRKAIDYMQGKGAYGNRAEYPLPDLILLDLKLPYVMGLDVLKWIREQPELAAIRVVVLTSSQLERDMEATFQLGGNGYLTKPATPEKLKEIL